MSERPEIDEAVYAAAMAAVPAPKGCIWCVDPAASSDRLRLFGNTDGAPDGQICVVYPDGVWGVGDPDPTHYQFAASGQEADLHAGMQRALKVAVALGWGL